MRWAIQSVLLGMHLLPSLLLTGLLGNSLPLTMGLLKLSKLLRH
jgi:hypothetical protein